MITEVEDLDHFRKLLKDAGDKLVVVDFTATWCGPCKQISPLFHELAEMPDNKNVVFLKVEVDDAGDVSEECNVSCMPTFQFYKNENKIFEFSGAQEKVLKQKVADLRG